MERLTILLLPVSFLTLLAHISFSAGNGKISGRIVDAQTRSPIPGNIRVAGTLYGANADTSGLYVLLELPPGVYEIRCSAVGYADRVVKGLTIAADNLRKLDFALQPVDINVDEVVVQADRLAVESSQTSARADYDGSEFRALPLNTTIDLISLSPGAFKQFLGGVSPVFSRTLIDGIDVTDETALWYSEVMGVAPSRVNGGRDIATGMHSSFAEPSFSAIEQATVFTGTSGADYSSAAGTVSYTLREGYGRWKGEAFVRTSQLGGLHHLGPNIYWDSYEYFAYRDYLARGNAGQQAVAKYYTWYPDKYAYGTRPDVTVSLAGGGALWENAGLYLSGTWHQSANRLPSEKKEWFDGSAKLTWAPMRTTRLSVIALLQDRGRIFGWKNRSYVDRWRYFLEGIPLWDGIHVTGGVTWSQLISKSTTYQLQASVVYDNVRQGFCDDNDDGVISIGEHGDFLRFSDTAQVNRYQAVGTGLQREKFFVAGAATALENFTTLLSSRLGWMVARPPIYYENTTSRVVSLKADLKSQLNEHHLVGGGAQVRLHLYDRVMRTGAQQMAGVTYKQYTEELLNQHPADLNFYVQDRMEFSGLIMNIGFRLEGRKVDAAPIPNWYDAPDTVGDGQGGWTITRTRGQVLPWSWFVAPQIGFSHPIGHTSAVHVSFSRSRLSVPYSYLFTNYNVAMTKTNVLYGPEMINVDQGTSIALKLGLGFQWAVAPATLLGCNVYYHDYSNMYLARLTVYPSSGSPKYNATTNGLSSDVRGFEISLQRGLTPLGLGISAEGRLAYAYGKVKVATPVPLNKTDYVAAQGDSAAYGGSLPFEDVSYWKRSVFESLGTNSTLAAGFNRLHRITGSFVIHFPWEIRLSGTGNFTSGFWYPEILKSARVLALAEGPWSRRVDLRLEKGFSLPGGISLDLFVDVMNVFEWSNVLAYYNTPEMGQLAWEVNGDPTGGSGINRPVTYEGTLIYDTPREAYLGVRVAF